LNKSKSSKQELQTSGYPLQLLHGSLHSIHFWSIIT